MNLPSYLKPPVREVSLAVTLNGLGLRTVDLGVIWNLFRAEYPSVEEQPPAPNPIEVFGGQVSAPQINFQILNRPPVPRLLLLNNSGSELAQIQTDRLGFNWRSGESKEPYPRFPHVLQRFRSVLDTVIAYSNSQPREKGQSIVATQCEISYVNEISVGEIGPHGDPDALLKVWQPIQSSQLGAAEDVRISSRHRLPNDSRTLGGRLLIDLQPVNRIDSTEAIYLLSLTVRGAPSSPDLDGVETFMNMGHELIVRTFSEITTTEIQHEWEVE